MTDIQMLEDQTNKKQLAVGSYFTTMGAVYSV